MKKIFKKKASWSVKKIDFNSTEIKASLGWVQEQKDDADKRKHGNISKLRQIVNV